MPIWTDPPRRLLNAFRRIRQEAIERSGDQITVERVQAVQDRSGYLVKDVTVPATGEAQLRAGEEVAVAKKRGIPAAVLAHSARRAQFPGVPAGANVVVEELFVDPVTGEVWFRDRNQVTDLEIRVVLPRNPDYVQWGIDGVYFVVRTSTPKDLGGGHSVGQTPLYHIFKLNRTNGDKPLAGRAKATFIRTESPIASNLALVDVRFVGSMSGGSSWARGVALWLQEDETLPLDPPVLVSETAVVIANLTASASQDLTRTIHLNATNYNGVFPDFFKSQSIDEVHVNEAGELIIVLQVDINFSLEFEYGFTQGQPGVTGLTGTQPVYIGSGCPPGTTEDFTSADSGFAYPVPGSHVFVINVTKGTILFRSCKPTIVKSIVTQYHQFRGAQTSLSLNRPNSSGLEEACQVLPFDPGATWTNAAETPNAAFGDIGVHGQISKGVDAWDPRLTFIGDPSTFFVTADTPESNTKRSGYSHTFLGVNGGLFSNKLGVTYSRTLRGITQNKGWEIAGRYIPKKATIPPAAPVTGVILLRVRSNNSPEAPSIGTAFDMAVYALDLDTGVLRTVIPSTANVGGGSEIGVSAKVGFDNLTRPWLDYVQPFGGANLHHVLIRTRESLGPTTTPATSRIWEYNFDANTLRLLDTATTPPTSNRDRIIAWAQRQFSVLRPDFTFWPADADLTVETILNDVSKAADIFLKIKDFASTTPGFNVSGFTAAAPGPVDVRDGAFPKTAGERKKLPVGVVPKKQNFVWDAHESAEIYPGPALRVVNDSAVLSPLGRFKSR